jgi:hypothetical protein
MFIFSRKYRLKGKLRLRERDQGVMFFVSGQAPWLLGTV